MSQKLDNQTAQDSRHDLLYNGARGIAVKILTRVERSDAYLDKLLDNERQNPELDSRDKRLLT